MNDNIPLKDFIAVQLDSLRNEIRSQNLNLLEKIDGNEKNNEGRRHELMNQMSLVKGQMEALKEVVNLHNEKINQQAQTKDQLEKLEKVVDLHKEKIKQQESFKKVLSGIAVLLIVGIIATLLAPLGINI